MIKVAFQYVYTLTNYIVNDSAYLCSRSRCCYLIRRSEVRDPLHLIAGVALWKGFKGMESIMGGGGPSAAKKMPLLSLTSSQPKRKKEPKAFVFELELGESNDKTYPEFSWAALVRDAKSKELEEKKKQGM